MNTEIIKLADDQIEEVIRLLKEDTILAAINYAAERGANLSGIIKSLLDERDAILFAFFNTEESNQDFGEWKQRLYRYHQL